ncbi:MAG TPA: hypothetical protein VMI73_20710, partial [Trebonia sp.]|nr:hypothetical protein [Trebonia sp.]
KSRAGRQCAEYTRSGFRYRDGQLLLAKMSNPLAFAWSWPDVDPADVRHSGTSRVRSAVKQEPRPARAAIPVLQDGE